MTSNAAPDPALLARLAAYAATPHGNRATRTWTIAELRPLFDPAIPVWTIAEQMGVPRATVTYELVRLRRAGFAVPERPCNWTRSPRTFAIEDDLRTGMTDAAVARRYGMSPGRINEIRRRAGIPSLSRRWTEAEREVLIAHQDQSAHAVAALVGRTLRAVDGERGRLIAQGRMPAKIVRPRGDHEPGSA